MPVALLMWLLPLLAVAMFSIKPEADFTAGDYWTLPSSFSGISNYGRVFFESEMHRYMLNSILITVPTAVGAVALSCMAGPRRLPSNERWRDRRGPTSGCDVLFDAKALHRRANIGCC